MSLEGMQLTVLATQVHDLKELITLYQQNIGTVDLYLKQGKITRAKSEIERFNTKLDTIEKSMHEKYGASVVEHNKLIKSYNFVVTTKDGRDIRYIGITANDSVEAHKKVDSAAHDDGYIVANIMRLPG